MLKFPLRSAFLALPLEGEAKERFQEVQKRLFPWEKLFSFQQADRPHLTLYYWSSLMEIEYRGMERQVEKIIARTSLFNLVVTEAETFEGEKFPRVLFLQIARSEELSTLKKLCPWPNPRHPEPSRRAFMPHITLARMKNPQEYIVHRKDILKALKDVSFELSFDRLRFYAEIEGVKQTPIQDFVFG